MRWVMVVGVLALAGCGGDEPPPAPQNFAALDYAFLPKLRLNVGSIDVPPWRMSGCSPRGAQAPPAS